MIRTPQHSLWARLSEQRFLVAIRVVVIAATFAEQQSRATRISVPHVIMTVALIATGKRKEEHATTQRLRRSLRTEMTGQKLDKSIHVETTFVTFVTNINQEARIFVQSANTTAV